LLFSDGRFLNNPPAKPAVHLIVRRPSPLVFSWPLAVPLQRRP
jgi:hypothetical protein